MGEKGDRSVTIETKPGGISTVEWRLLRLVRCLHESQTDNLVHRVARAVLDENSEKFHAKVPDPRDQPTEAETDDQDRYEWFLLDCFWRVEAASHEIEMLRDYDNAFWECFGEPVEYVLFGNSSVDNYAKALAEYYIEFCDGYGEPLQSDVAESEEEAVDDLKFYSELFGRFLEEWREVAVEQIVAKANVIQ